MHRLTDKQQYAVDLNTSALVSAAAGSGKTRVITEKVVKLISEGADIRDMAIMTYTSAAAAEMKSRIFRALVSAAGEDPRLREQADLVAVSKIGTCHSFCIKILRENYELAGLAYNFTVLNPETAGTLREKAALDIMTELMNDGSEEMRAFLLRYSKRLKKEKLYSEIESVTFDVPDAYPDPDDWLVRCASMTKEYYAGLMGDEDGLDADYDHTMPDTVFLIKLIRLIRERYAEYKAEMNGVDYGEILCRAYGVLQKKSVTFSYVFVDEFQDSNPIQKAVIDLISEGNTVFFVGDIKQCVYAFNKADPEIFSKVADDFKSGAGSLVTMNENFRSSKKIIDAVNHVMERVMSRELGGVDYNDDERLIARSDNTGEVSVLVHGKGYHSCTQGDMIAEKILSLVGTKVRFGGEEHTVGYGDIAILMRTKTRVADITKSLEDRGIPFTTNFDEKYPSRCADLFVSILKAIENDHDDMAVLETMKYKGVGFSDEEIARIRAEHREGSFTDAVDSYIYDHEIDESDELVLKLLGFKGKLRSMRTRFSAYSLEAALFQLTEEFLLLDYAKIKSDEEFKAVIQLIDVIVSCGERTLTGVIGFLEALKVQKKAYAFISSEKRPDSVSLMTIHRSKGLEFPIVFIAYLETQFREDDLNKKTTFMTDKRYGILPLYIDKKRRVKRDTVLRAACSAEKFKGLASEELRLLYVAMTRAMCSLYMCMSVPFRDDLPREDCLANVLPEDSERYKSMMQFILKAWADDAEAFEDAISIEIPEDIETVEDVTERVASTLEDLEPGIKRERLSFEPRFIAPAKTSVSALKRLQGSRVEYRPRLFDEDDSVQAADFGTVVHSLMQRCVPDKVPGDELKAMKDNLLLTDAEYERISSFLPCIEKFMASDLCARIGCSERILKEIPFILNVDASEIGIAEWLYGSGVTLLQGVIDMAFMENGKWVLVDYKTDRIRDDNRDELISTYSVQLDYYAKALFRLTGIEVGQRYLAFIRTGETVTV